MTRYIHELDQRPAASPGGVMTAGTMMAFSHATMIPLMAVAMMLRFREYAGHKQGHGLPASAQESGL